MHCVRKITEDITLVGASDRRLALFENLYPIPEGVSYNAYVVNDEKNVLIDTTDRSVLEQFKENVAYALGGKGLDYIIVNHMEPDHSATLEEIAKTYPQAKIVCNAKISQMIKNYFALDTEGRMVIVKEGDVLETGKHKFTFVMAPMVHWPEVMVTYDLYDKTLYSADAFGSFGAIGAALFSDEVDYDRDYIDDARRYYTNIVGKYGTQVQAVLKKAAGLEIARICALHGLVWRNHFNYILDKYTKWSTYTPEVKGVLIAYASVYGNTENAVNILAAQLADRGIKDVKICDVSKTHPSYILSDAFKYSNIVFASTTYNAGIFTNMHDLVSDIVAHGLKNRAVSVIENGSWAPTAGKLISDELAKLPGTRFVGEKVTVLSSVKQATAEKLAELADAIAADIKGEEAAQEEHAGAIDNKAFFKISYGLFVLTSGDRNKMGGCIVNTVAQVTDSPKRVSVAVNKANYTCDLIAATGVFNASVIDENADFKLFQDFGFRSARDCDKFAGRDDIAYAANKLPYLTKACNAFISAKVIEKVDVGTHIIFIGEVTEAKVLADAPSCTYDYYSKNIKPAPPKKEGGKKGFVCKICGYVYEGEKLPEDFVCPWCKHGASDFEPLK